MTESPGRVSRERKLCSQARSDGMRGTTLVEIAVALSGRQQSKCASAGRRDLQDLAEFLARDSGSKMRRLGRITGLQRWSLRFPIVRLHPFVTSTNERTGVPGGRKTRLPGAAIAFHLTVAVAGA